MQFNSITQLINLTGRICARHAATSVSRSSSSHQSVQQCRLHGQNLISRRSIANQHCPDSNVRDRSHESNPVNRFTYRTHHCGELRVADVGQTVTLCGWVQYQRGGKFLVLRDGYGMVQLMISDGAKVPDQFKKLPLESVIKAVGVVRARPADQINANMETGEIEIQVNNVELLGRAQPKLPFQIRHFHQVHEDTRLKYRYLDLRRQELQANLRLRSQLLRSVRDFFHQNSFSEIETPTLFKQTPGGAQEFVVPTRWPGKFFNLVQSPQQFKQLLMVGGMDRYFQIARCYRDEGTKPDRQPEFTQIDIELSFTTMEQVMSLIEDLLRFIWPGQDKGAATALPAGPFPRITYEHAMKHYGTDKPDTRTDKAPHSTEMSFVWVYDFPLFEAAKSDDTEVISSCHHPFTSPISADIDKVYREPLEVRGQHFDLVLNGVEIGGGSIRINDSALQRFVLEQVLKTDASKMQYFLEALESGCPPHGGIALGFDRLVAIMAGANSIRDVMAFPKSSDCKDLMSEAPSTLDDSILAHYHLKRPS